MYLKDGRKWEARTPHIGTKGGGKGSNSGSRDNVPSIDRIDSTKGYSKDNIEIVSWRWNNCKADMSAQEMFHIGKYGAIKLGYKWPPEPEERRK